ncbi:outer membrane protein assembly factor BamE [Verticiella sediminum]|uniref:Outer membrane protein assembly factor BamE n=1 Tax=Verticiella sediminum TaxID=1247510 RepID=A0A556A937_9BURK|nr:outer membrane protein assembly factor BamE [Verticiella sediminum]TSH89399.1 outer membrane protein assembly factor BamE [Verticiella sediminum]
MTHHRPLSFASCALAAAAVLAGCTTLEQRLPPGTATDAVVAAMGKPSLSCPLPDGGQRLVWSGQPFRQASWAADAGPDGRTTGVQQVLTDAGFAQLRTGEWNRDRVRCTFGPPAQIGAVGSFGHPQEVWSYAYKQDTVWNSLMHVHFDDAGYVTRVYPGPDPAYDPDRGMFGAL